MRKTCLLLLVAITAGGCVMKKTNNIEVWRGAIFAYGKPDHGIDQLNGLEINCVNMSHEDQTNLWIGFPQNKKIALSAITFEEAKALSEKEHINPENNMRRFYYAGGYSFEFINQVPISFQASKYEFALSNKIAFTRIGSFSNNRLLTLPCTLNQFEEVFGKPDRIRRWWSW